MAATSTDDDADEWNETERNDIVLTFDVHMLHGNESSTAAEL